MQGLALLAAALVLGGCTSKPEPAEPAPRPTETAEAAAESAPQPRRQRIIDPQGRLIPSDDFLAGVRLPRGMELVREEALLHVYHIRAPIEKVLGYFGPMLITGNVERRGKGAVYRGASVRGAEINPTKVDVSILDLERHRTRVAITELPPPSPHAPSDAQTKAAAMEAFRTLD